jgi:hypothetical protein
MGGCERLARFYREQWAGGGHYLAYCALGNYQDASPILKQEPNQRLGSVRLSLSWRRLGAGVLLGFPGLVLPEQGFLVGVGDLS